MAKGASEKGKSAFWKWASIVGVAGLVTVWATINTVVARWNAIPALQMSLAESQGDRQKLHTEISGHQAQQAVDMKEIQMTLKAIEKVQLEQKEELRQMGSKIDMMYRRSSSATPKVNGPLYESPDAHVSQ